MGSVQRNVSHSRSPVRRPHQDTQSRPHPLEMKRGKAREERHKVCELTRELDYTKSKLKKQTTLKKMYINRDMEAKQEQKRGRWEVEADLQKERQRNKALQEEIDFLRASKRKFCSRYQAEVFKLKQENLKLQDELDRQIKFHAERTSKGLEPINLPRAKQHAPRQRLGKEKQADEHNVGGQSRLRKRRRLECCSPLRKKMRRLQLEEEHNLQPLQPQTPQQQEQEAMSALHNDPEALEDDSDSETFLPDKNDKRSVWKRARNFSGLKIPQACEFESQNHTS